MTDRFTSSTSSIGAVCAEVSSALGLDGPPNPVRPGEVLAPFEALLQPPRAQRIDKGHHGAVDVEIAESQVDIHPDLPAIPVWGFGRPGCVSAPGPLLEVPADQRVVVRWRNRLPGSVHPQDPSHPIPSLPFAAVVVEDPDGDTDSAQNHLGAQGGVPQDTSMAPIGWTSVHLHGAHSHADADGWPDNMTAAGGQQVSGYDNTADNLDLGLAKVGAFLWYHDHAMNGTRYHVYAGLAGGYFVRDPAEAALGLPTSTEQGEVLLVLQDRNLTTTGAGGVELLHKTTTDTAEFFGPLTLVDGRLWPRLPLRPAVHRLRLLNSSNARSYRLHLVTVTATEHGTPVVTPQHDRVQVIGTGGGLLWRSWQLQADDSLTLTPAERVDVLVDLSGLPVGAKLYLVNSAQAPFGGDPAPSLADLLTAGDRPGRNPYPWVLRIDVDPEAPTKGQPRALYAQIAGTELNPAFRRLVHEAHPAAGGEPEQLAIAGHAHRTILLAETTPPGHLYLQEIVADPAGGIELQLPGENAPARYRVEGWPAEDKARSSTRVSFYDRIALRPQVGQWQLWRFVNVTGDTHPMHIHQSAFQPLGAAGARLMVTDAAGANLYDPDTRTTSAPLLPDTDPTHVAPRAFEPHEVHGWKDVVRVDPGNVVTVAVRFDLPGRYVYHCHIVEHEDTEMMRPFVVTVTDMTDGQMSHM
ncbi:MAG: multicopper oxidase family protein [Pseudonocardiaceae bacterium]